MDKYLYHGKIAAKQGQGDQLKQVLLQASQLVAPLKGCLLYVISSDLNDPDLVWVTEIWERKEDHDNSLEQENVRTLIMQAMPLIDGPPQKGQELTVLGGHGV